MVDVESTPLIMDAMIATSTFAVRQEKERKGVRIGNEYEEDDRIVSSGLLVCR